MTQHENAHDQAGRPEPMRSKAAHPTKESQKPLP